MSMEQQPVHEKMRPEMVIGMQNEIRIGIQKLLFWERDVEQQFLDADSDFVLHSDDRFKSHLLGNGLCMKYLWSHI